MPEFIRAYTERTAESRPGDAIRFIASTSDVVRDNMSVDADGWQLDNFKRNPVFLWSHNYYEPPIGKVTHIAVEKDNLVADVVFDQDDPNAVLIERKYRSGILNAVSVGFNIIDYTPSNGKEAGRATKTELLELSGVPVPADPKALAERQKRALRDLSSELAALSEDDGDPQPPASPAPESVRSSWDETSAAMVELFRAYDPRSDEQRREDYDRLARDYGRHKKTPPEFATNAELEAFDADTLRGRFLEGETDLHPDRFTSLAQRKGAVISRKNFEDLTQAAALISGVLERSTKAKPEADATETDDERAATDALARWLNTKG